MTKYLILFALVAFLSKTTSAIDANCDYYQDVVSGTTYYVYNREYPQYYSGARSCRWYAKSATNLQLSCDVQIPPTANCAGDRLSVSASGNLQLTDAQNYCGNGTFTVTSTGNSLNVVFTSYAGTRGGRFFCTLRATAATNCNCGWKNPMRIVGGTATGVNEYPMMAGLVDTDRRLLYCGGTIISTKHVLTAAHCLLANTPVNKIAVLVGDHDINSGAYILGYEITSAGRKVSPGNAFSLTVRSTDTSSSSLHVVQRFIQHPSYNSETQANDIAVITVVDTIIFTMAVGPACLPFSNSANTFAGTKVDALGWGTTEFAGATSNILQKVTLDVITVASCQRTFPVVTNNQMCTFTPGKDACQFDSGGPLLWQNPNSRRVVCAGIISYGQVCADTTPGVNTRVGPYLPWIVSVTPDANYCRLE